MTILIITENQLSQLEICLETIQLWGESDPRAGELRVAVVDNASADDTCKWLEAQGIAYAVEEQRQSFGVILNEAIQAFDLHDDLMVWNPCFAMTPGFLSSISELLDKEKDVGIVGPSSNAFAVNGEDIQLRGEYEEVLRLLLEGRRQQEILIQEKLDYPVLYFRSSVLSEIGSFCESCMSDRMTLEEYQIRAVEAGYRLARCKGAVAYRFWENRETNDGLKGNILLLRSGSPIIEYSFTQVGQAYRRIGYHVEEFPISDLPDKTIVLRNLLTGGIDRAFIFNNYGFTIEDYDHINIWDKFQVVCVNFLFDHPVYSSHVLPLAPEHSIVTCVDRRHVEYVKRFYPGVRCFFLPLAGQDISGNGRKKAWVKRSIDILYLGGYEKLDGLKLSPYSQMALEKIQKYPDKTFDMVIQEFYSDERLDDSDLLKLMQGAGRADWYQKVWIRREVLSVLAQNGIFIDICGGGWENTSLAKLPNVRLHGAMSQTDCLKLMQDSKIVLNVMPNFKDGIHDRVINAMLAGAVALTDDSGYLSQAFEREKDYVVYSLERLEELPEIVRRILGDPVAAVEMTERAYETAVRGHTWDARIGELEERLSEGGVERERRK